LSASPPPSSGEDLAAVPWFGILATMFMVACYTLTIGLSYPLLSLILERQGVDGAMVGLSAAMTPLGLIVSAPLAILCLIGGAGLLLAIGTWQALLPWLALRFLLGICDNGLFIISETWINQLANERVRGRVMGLYTTIASAGFALGPFILAVTGSEGLLPFAIGAGAMLAGLPFLLSVRRIVPGLGGGHGSSFLGFLPLAPVLLAAVAMLALYEQSMLSLFPIYGLRHGLSTETIGLALGVFAIGATVMQYPLGWASDRLPRRGLMAGCASLTVVGTLLLPLIIGGSVFWPVIFLLGGIAFGVYTLALAELGDRFSGVLLLAGNAAFAMMWGLGGLVGPPISGAAMELAGPEALPAFLAGCYLLLLLLILLRRLRR
jgi:MFS family permease